MDRIPFQQEVRRYRLNLRGTPGAIPYGLGCAYLADAGRSEPLETMIAAYESGFRYFDTSANYRQSETVLGRFVEQVPRDSLFLATKLRRFDPFLPPGEAAELAGQSVARSLETLRSATIDLIQIHDNEQTGRLLEPGGVVDALAQLRDQGVVRYIGMATRPQPVLAEAVRSGLVDTVLTFSDYTPLGQAAEALIRLAGSRDVGVINGSPLAGQLIGNRDPRQMPLRPDDHRRLTVARASAFYRFCRHYGFSPIKPALHFPLRCSGIDMNLTGPSNLHELKSTLNMLREPPENSFWEAWNEWKSTNLEE